MTKLMSRRVALIAMALFATGITVATAQEARLPGTVEQHRPVLAANGMVVAQERRGAEIGRDVLARGGNAVDAAVATGFALAVTLPKAGNLGGGGFMVVHLADRNQDIAIDYREAAPRDTTADVFLDQDDNYDPKKSRESGLGVG